MIMHSEEFLNIISFDSLYKAHRRARLGKRWKKEVIEFELNLSENLWNIHYDLLYGKYKLGGYHNFKIYDPKEREIQAISYRDRVVQHAICDGFLTPLLERRLFYYNVACRKDKGTALAISALKSFLLKHYKKRGISGYFLKLDVKKYFDSIDHELLKLKLSKLAIPQDIMKVLFNIVDSYGNGKGLPMGNQTSQCFALLYLDCIDRLIKEKFKVKYYLRYMDDMILIVDSKKIARNILYEVEKSIKNQLLFLNKKSQIIPVKNGINFLGRRFCLSKKGAVLQKLRHETKRRILQKIKEKAWLRDSNKLQKLHINSTYVSYKGMFKGVTSRGLYFKVKTILAIV